jgi:hypothetical protein
MNNLSTDVNNLEWRRNRIMELRSRGYNQDEIAVQLGIGQATVCRDLKHIRQSLLQSSEGYLGQMNFDNEKMMVGLDQSLKELWKIVGDPATNAKEKLHAQSLIMQCLDKMRQANDGRRVIKEKVDNGRKEKNLMAKTSRQREIDAITEPARTTLGRYLNEGKLPKDKSLEAVVIEALAEAASTKL